MTALQHITASILLGLLFGASLQQIVAQDDLPCAYVGSDLEGLREALAKEPDNIGLRMRIVRRLLEDWRDSTDPRGQRRLLKVVENELAEIRKLGPDFPYVYRVMALQHFRRGEYEDFLKDIAAYEKVAPLDYELRTLVVKSYMRLAIRKENPQPERKIEAARYVGKWFEGGEAPVFGVTLGAVATWLIDPSFRDELIRLFEDRYKTNPKNINLIISYAACLTNLGRNESAWDLIHAGEKVGLADFQTGGRHPVVNLLKMECPEQPTAETYDGFDVKELERLGKEYPENCSLAFRTAMNYKIKAVAAERITVLIEQRIKQILEKKPGTDVSKNEARKKEWQDRVDEFYRKALPPAERAYRLNPTQEAITLLLGDIYSRLGKEKDAVRCFEETLQKVPFYSQLRERLAESYRKDGRLEDMARELIEVCKVVSVRPETWKKDEPGSLLPVPTLHLEKFIREQLDDAAARNVLLAAFEKAAKETPKNPNLKTFLAMMYFFAGNKEKANYWMREAERQGICGEAGAEHLLATEIYSRERW